MKPEAEKCKGRLWRLVDGYAGYGTPKTRTRTCEIFEGFLAEKTVLIHTFLDKKFREYTADRAKHGLLLPLSESLKLLSEAAPLLEYDRKRLFYFFEEFRIPESLEEELYFIDFRLLKQLGHTVDQISSFQLAAENKFLDLNDYLADLKKQLSSRHQLITDHGEQLKSRFDELSQVLRYVRTRKANEQTYDKIKDFWEKYPDNLVIIREVFECFRNASSSYLNLSANVPMVSLYKEALLYLEQYEHLVKKLETVLSDYSIDSPEEDACIDLLKERLRYAPDFSKDRNFLLMSIKRIEERKEKLKTAGAELGKAEAFFKSGQDLEVKMDFDGAINFYNAALQALPDYREAAEALVLCQKRKRLGSDFQKANNFFACGNTKQARQLYERVLQMDPEFKEAQSMLDRIKDVEGGS